MPSRRHQLLAHLVPRVRRSRDLDSVEAEHARLTRWHAQVAGAPLPTAAVPRFDRRFDVERSEEQSFPSWCLVPRGTAPQRTVVWVHGGGFVSGIDPFHVRYAARLASRLDRPRGVRVVLPDYPLAPEHTWRDSHDGLVDLVAGWAERSPGGLVLGGDSAGGGLALAVALSLRDRGLPLPERMVLHAPWVDLTTSTPETTAFAEQDTWLFLGKLHAYASWWAGSPDDLARPEVSPALADLAGLPPTLVFQGTRDLLTPGTRLLVDRGREAGWPLEYVEQAGLIHVYPLLPLVPEARAAWRRTEEFLR